MSNELQVQNFIAHKWFFTIVWTNCILEMTFPITHLDFFVVTRHSSCQLIYYVLNGIFWSFQWVCSYLIFVCFMLKSRVVLLDVGKQWVCLVYSCEHKDEKYSDSGTNAISFGVVDILKDISITRCLWITSKSCWKDIFFSQGWISCLLIDCQL